MVARVIVDGIPEFVGSMSQMTPVLQQQLGVKNQSIGPRQIAAASPKPETSGSGPGAMPQAEPSNDQLKILAGGGHRVHVPKSQWGTKFVRRQDQRPYLLRSMEQDMPRVEQDYLGAIDFAATAVGLVFIQGG